MKHGRNLSISISILFSHRLRTSLSVLGVSAGVAAMILIVSIGDGIGAQMRESFKGIGADLLLVRAGKFVKMGPHEHQTALVTTLKQEDAAAIKSHCEGILAVSAAIARPMAVSRGSLSTQTQVEAIDRMGLDLKNVVAASGRLFVDSEVGARRSVAIIGHEVKKSLFPDVDPVGQLVTVGRLPFTVVGVAVEKGTDVNGANQDDTVFIPLDTGAKRLFHTNFIETIYVKAYDEKALPEITGSVTEELRKRHRIRRGQEDDFTVQDQTVMVEVALGMAKSTTRLVTAVASISLIVAGIGILAVMLMSVRERRWEIGLRRAFGARRRDIQIQFLSEAAILAVLGGILGVSIGALAVLLFGYFDVVPAVFSSKAALVSVAVSAGIGIIFGIHPAKRASELEPITALGSGE